GVDGHDGVAAARLVRLHACLNVLCDGRPRDVHEGIADAAQRNHAVGGIEGYRAVRNRYRDWAAVGAVAPDAGDVVVIDPRRADGHVHGRRGVRKYVDAEQVSGDRRVVDVDEEGRAGRVGGLDENARRARIEESAILDVDPGSGIDEHA